MHGGGVEITYILFVLLGFFASIIAAVFGFGSAMVMLAIGPYLLPAEQAVALAAVLFGVSTLTKTLLFRHQLDWRVVGIMAAASMPFAYLGGTFLPQLPPGLLHRLLGLMILFYLATRHFDFLPRFKLGTKGLVAGAAAYGFTSGLIGSGNVIKVVMFREMNISREAFVGAMAATSVLASGAKTLAYYQAGLLDHNLAWPIAGLATAAIVAALLGRSVLKKVSNQMFDQGVQLVLAVAAIGLLVK